jgi:hypothetical protein
VELLGAVEIEMMVLAVLEEFYALMLMALWSNLEDQLQEEAADLHMLQNGCA